MCTKTPHLHDRVSVESVNLMKIGGIVVILVGIIIVATSGATS